MPAHRVLVVEDSAATADFVCRQLMEGGLIPDTARGGLEALRKAHGEAYALAVVDVDIASEPDGVETADWLGRLYGLPVVVFSMRSESDIRQRIVDAEQAGVLLRPFRMGELPGAVSNLLARRPWLDVVREGGLFRPPPPRPAPWPLQSSSPLRDGVQTPAMPAGFAELSGREWQIIRDLIDTPSAQAVARKRQRSPHTVHNHLKSIFKKLQVHSVAELLSLMLRLSRQPLV